MDTNLHQNEVRKLEFTARHLWRFMMPFCSKHLSPRCRKCVLPNTCSPLDENGICQICREAKPDSMDLVSSEKSTAMGLEMDDILSSLAGKGKHGFDALLLYSGGKDSTWMLHKLRTEHPGLRIMTLLVDNGFMSPLALKTAESTLQRFNVPHIHYKLKPSLVKSVFRYALTHLDLQEGYSIVDLMDGFMTFDTARHTAAQMKIPAVLCGLSRIQVQNVFGDTGYVFQPEDEEKKVESHAGIMLKDCCDPEDMDFWWDGTRYAPEDVPQFLLPMYAWDPDESKIVEALDQNKLIPRSQSSPLLTNNALIPVIAIVEVAKFGFSCFEVEFAKMVRAGKVERGYWLNLYEMLEFSARSGRFINKSVKQTLQALDLRLSDLGIR